MLIVECIAIALMSLNCVLEDDKLHQFTLHIDCPLVMHMLLRPYTQTHI